MGLRGIVHKERRDKKDRRCKTETKMGLRGIVH